MARRDAIFRRMDDTGETRERLVATGTMISLSKSRWRLVREHDVRETTSRS